MHVGIIHYAAPPVVGGVEQTIFHHARTLIALGHQVTVVAGHGDPFLPDITYRSEPLAGSRTPVITEATRQLSKGEVPDNFDESVAKTKQALLKHFGNCDVVIGHNFFTLHKNLILTTAVYQLTVDGEGPPWVAWHHDFAWLRRQYQPELFPGDPWELLKRPWPGVRHVTVSQAQQENLARLYDIPLDDITEVPPGVNPAEFYRCDSTVTRLISHWDLLEAECVFLVPARITRRKNLELGLRWLAAVREVSGWDARLIVTGPPGPHNPTNAAYLDYLLELRAELGLEDAAHFAYQAQEEFIGVPLFLLDEDLANLYQLVDAMMFPSRQEGFGIPILEAGLARLPIFATDLPPFQESAGNLACLFAPDAPATEVAQTIVEALQQDRAFQLRRRVLEHFTWRGIVKNKVLPLLEQAVG
jgi:glycosyltransferase involved in cell wall biosynthesis